MIYTHHNFYSNFTSSVKSGDNAMTINIIVSELSDIIVHEVEKLIEAINKVGLKASESQTDEALVDLILKNLPKNANLLNAISFLIAEYNSEINKKGDKAEDSLKIVKNIADGLTTVSKKIGSDSMLKSSVKKDIMEQIVTKSTDKGDYKRVIWNKVKSRKKLFIALGVTTLVGVSIYAIYLYKKGAQSEAALAAMGLAANGLPIPVPVIAPPIAPIQMQAPAPVITQAPLPIAQPPMPIASGSQIMPMV